jgi:hypothetical protein
MEVLGHSEIGTTANIYGHIMPELTSDATDRVSELLWAWNWSRCRQICRQSAGYLALPQSRSDNPNLQISRAPVAQWIEHQTSDLRVEGSNPSRRASNTSPNSSIVTGRDPDGLSLAT